MNSKQRKTLERIYERPTRADLRWQDARSLLEAIGATVDEGTGSRIAVDLKGRTFTMHKPHGKELKQYQVKRLSEFLEEMGVVP